MTAPSGWPGGSFEDLRSFEFGTDARDHFSPTRLLNVLPESRLLKNLRLVGDCDLPDDEPPAVALALPRGCAMIGNGSISLTWHMDTPASTNVFLDTPPARQ